MNTDNAVKNTMKGWSYPLKGNAYTRGSRANFKREAKRARRQEDKKFIEAGVADSQDTRFIPIGGQSIYREEEVAALEMAKLYQDLLDIQVARMRNECMLSRDIYFDDADEDYLWN